MLIFMYPVTRKRSRHFFAPAGRPLAVLSLALLLSGCGRKTPPRPPELIAPEPIQHLRASVSKDGVLLRWERPQRYADHSRMFDLGGFRVQRAQGDTTFKTITALTVDDRDRFRQLRHFRYVDADVETNRTYRYRVFSFTLGGDLSRSSNTVTIHLDQSKAAKKK